MFCSSDVFESHVLPFLNSCDLTQLSQCNTAFHEILSSDIVARRRALEDFFPELESISSVIPKTESTSYWNELRNTCGRMVTNMKANKFQEIMFSRYDFSAQVVTHITLSMDGRYMAVIFDFTKLNVYYLLTQVTPFANPAATPDLPNPATPDPPSTSTPDPPSTSTPDLPRAETPDPPSTSTPDPSTSSESAADNEVVLLWERLITSSHPHFSDLSPQYHSDVEIWDGNLGLATDAEGLQVFDLIRGTFKKDLTDDVFATIRRRTSHLGDLPYFFDHCSLTVSTRTRHLALLLSSTLHVWNCNTLTWLYVICTNCNFPELLNWGDMCAGNLHALFVGCVLEFRWCGFIPSAPVALLPPASQTSPAVLHKSTKRQPARHLVVHCTSSSLLKIFDVASGVDTGIELGLGGRRGGIYVVTDSWDSDGNYYLAAFGEGTVSVWSSKNFECIFKTRSSDHSPSAVFCCFLGGSLCRISGSEQSIRLACLNKNEQKWDEELFECEKLVESRRTEQSFVQVIYNSSFIVARPTKCGLAYLLISKSEKGWSSKEVEVGGTLLACYQRKSKLPGIFFRYEDDRLSICSYW